MREPSEEYLAALQELATKVNGIVYHGDRLEAVVATARLLREQPELARRLLDPEVDAGEY